MKPVPLIATTIFTLATAFAASHPHPSVGSTPGRPLPAASRARDAAGAQSDTLTSGVRPYPGDNGQVLNGATHDLSLLNVRTLSIDPDDWFASYFLPDSSDELLIVKEGSLIVDSYDSITGLGPGGVALFNAGALYYLHNGGKDTASIYLFRFKSRQPPPATQTGGANPSPAGSGIYPFILDWPSMPVQHTAKGESRQIFSRPTYWLSKLDLHATTLNPGEVSHLPHIHRAEEIILMRSGHVRMYINGNHYPATGGDLVFLASGNPHALENHSAQRCEYFALQWLP